MAKFTGFSEPQSNYFRLPNDWIDIIKDMSLGELKVVMYVLRHTWGFNDYKGFKRITIDEFLNGRKRRDGSRMDTGCGLSRQSIITGLNLAVEHGYLIVKIDDRDKARVKKEYRLVMKNDENSRVQNFDGDGQNLPITNSGVKDLDVSGVQNLDAVHRKTQNEKQTIKTNEKNTLSPSGDGMRSHPSGFFPDDDKPKASCGCQKAAAKLFNSLLIKGLVNKRRSKPTKWAKTISDFLKENDHITKKEFQATLIWYCTMIGEEFIPEAYSAESFCTKYVNIRSAMLRQERMSNGYGKNGHEMNNDTAVNNLLEKIRNGA